MKGLGSDVPGRCCLTPYHWLFLQGLDGMPCEWRNKKKMTKLLQRLAKKEKNKKMKKGHAKMLKQRLGVRRFAMVIHFALYVI